MLHSETDQRYMARALELAARGLYTTTPNPRVGCVLVREHVVVGEGSHERAGEPHAEVHALRAAAGKTQGATAYVTLEPCAHHGRTPPCSEALIAAHVERVVIAMRDPNPLVSGKGIAALRAAGIEVECGLLEREALELNIGFVSRMTRGRPWLRVKIASSVDGRTALANGRSQWITSPEARRDGHHWRARTCAIMTGIGTVKNDDPQLTVRDIATPRQPLRIVIDARLETPPAARVVGAGTLIVAAVEDARLADPLRAKGAEILLCAAENGRVDMRKLLQELGSRSLNEVHVEAGRRLNGALLQSGLIDELFMYLAPRVLGDSARGMFDMPELENLSEALELEFHELTRIGPDLRIIARPRESH